MNVLECMLSYKAGQLYVCGRARAERACDADMCLLCIAILCVFI